MTRLVVNYNAKNFGPFKGLVRSGLHESYCLTIQN